jgi:sec-independent protein translocase protein TatC
MLIHHIKELKNIIKYIVVYSLVLFLLCYYYSDVRLFILVKPLINQENWISQRFIFTELTEAFFIYVLVSRTLTSYRCFPFYCFIFRRFNSRGRFKYEKKKLRKLVCILYSLFLFALYFSYFNLLPNLWCFLLNLQTYSINQRIVIELEAKLTGYIILILKIIQFFRLSFQFPLRILFITELKIVSLETFIKLRKLIFIGFLILGAFLSPPDLYSQFLVAIPLMVLYEITLFVLLILKKKKG